MLTGPRRSDSCNSQGEALRVLRFFEPNGSRLNGLECMSGPLRGPHSQALLALLGVNLTRLSLVVNQLDWLTDCHHIT